MEPSKEVKFKLENPWTNSSNCIRMAARLSLVRNIDKFKFPHKLAQERRRQLVDLFSDKIVVLQGLSKAELYRAETLSPSDKEYLSEHFLLEETFQEAYGGEAFCIDQSGEFLATINVQDHLSLIILDGGKEGRPEEKLAQLFGWEKKLQEAFSFAYSPQFGYLTANPNRAGTGFRIASFLHIPVLLQSGAFTAFWQKWQEEMLHVENFLGHPSSIGDIAVVTNHFCLGINEEVIFNGVFLISEKIEEEERRLREEVKAKGSSLWKDKISRAFALSTLSYQIESLEELLGEISLLKLGVDLGWIQGIGTDKLNRLFLSCRRTHLSRLLDEKVAPDQLPHTRAAFIHRELEGATLTIS